MREWFNIYKSINTINHIKGLKDKNDMISIDSEKAFDKMQRAFMIKVLENIGQEGRYFNILKVL